MITRGDDEDAQMMREQFPGFHRTYSDPRGTVWSR
jgi:hypothetical protein